MKHLWIAMAAVVFLAVAAGIPATAQAQADVDTKAVGKALKIELTPEQLDFCTRGGRRGLSEVEITLTADQAKQLRGRFSGLAAGEMKIVVDPGHLIEGNTVMINQVDAKLKSIRK